MFFLRIHSGEANRPLSPEEVNNLTIARTWKSDANLFSYPRFRKRRGEVQLFRKLCQSSPNPSSTNLFVVSVPNYFSFNDFIRFCGALIDHESELLFIRDDGMKDRYSILIKLGSPSYTKHFYRSVNGKKFSPAMAEVCHIVKTVSVEYAESEDIARTPPAWCSELPTCPICLERLDPDISGITSTLCDHSFRCKCISKWTNLSCKVCRFFHQKNTELTCSVCGTFENLYACLICGFVGCARFIEGHGLRHWKDTQHCFTLDLKTQEIWDYVRHKYVHRSNQSNVHEKLEQRNSQGMLPEGDYGNYGNNEESESDAALYDSKVAHYEPQLVEALSKMESSISETVDNKAMTRMQDIQNKLEKRADDKNAVAYAHRDDRGKGSENWEDLATILRSYSIDTSAVIQAVSQMANCVSQSYEPGQLHVSSEKIFTDLSEIPDLQEGELLQAFNVLTNNGRKYESFKALPIRLRKSWILMEIKK